METIQNNQINRTKKINIYLKNWSRCMFGNWYSIIVICKYLWGFYKNKLIINKFEFESYR